MSKLNEEGKSEQSSRAPEKIPAFDPGAAPALDSSATESPRPAAKSRSPRKRTADEALDGAAKPEKPRRAGQRKSGGEQVAVAQDATASALKPGQAKRVKKQPDSGMTAEAEAAIGQERASSSQAAREARDPIAGGAGANAMPPITPSAIKYLGKKNATLADYLKLDPDSLAFVRYHLKRLHQIEEPGMVAGAYAGATTRPVSLALQRFADARVQELDRSRGNVDRDARAGPMEPAYQAQTGLANPSYRQKVTDYPSYASVVVQLRKLDLAVSKTGPDVQAGEASLDDNQRMHRVLGTAQILMATPIRELALADAAALAAVDIKEVRAIEDPSARRLALSAVIESGLTQPRYHSEFARQAPDLAASATQAHRAAKADWGLAYGIISELSNLVDSETSPAKEQIAALARRTIAGIRAIEIPQYREQALAFSHQAGLLHPRYQAELADNAPDLVVAAALAYKVEGSRTKAGPGRAHTDENSIEQGPILVTRNDQPIAYADRTEGQDTSEPERADKELAAAAASKAQAVMGTLRRPSLGKRMLLAIRDAMNQAGTWLATHREAGLHPAAMAPVSMDKPVATPVQTGDKSSVVPETVARRFLKVESEYYFQDRTPAFSDRGSKLATRGASLEVVRSLVEIAKARGWETITVKGSEEFRRSSWMEATLAGLSVVGYKPTSLDLAALAGRPASNTVEKGNPREKDREYRGSTFQQPIPQPDASQSQAKQAAMTKPTPEKPKADAALIAKANAFREGKPALVVKNYPDLAAAYGLTAAARAFAADKLPEAAREAFVDMARRHVIEKIMEAEQIHGPKIYFTPTRTTELKGPASTGGREHGHGQEMVAERAR